MQLPTVTVDVELCKECGICISFCPTTVFTISGASNRRGYKYPIAAHIEKCTCCRICEYLCPEFAIDVAVKAGALTS
ncbi:MAG: ferredoxin family protein [Candidatus Bathyarchaeia archaeon]